MKMMRLVSNTHTYTYIVEHSTTQKYLYILNNEEIYIMCTYDFWLLLSHLKKKINVKQLLPSKPVFFII